MEATLESKPSHELRQHQVTAMRLQLLGPVKQRDWRKLPVAEIRRFLVFLFGENPNKTGNGITVFREHGRWRIAFKGQVEFFHELCDGHAYSLVGRSLLKTCDERDAAAHEAIERLENKRGVATGRTYSPLQNYTLAFCAEIQTGEFQPSHLRPYRWSAPQPG